MQNTTHNEEIITNTEPTELELETFISGYIEGMLWSTTETITDGKGNEVETYNLDERFGPEAIHPSARISIEEDCAAFLKLAKSFIESEPGMGDFHDRWNRSGIDFWLTRAGHGCGYWDGDWEFFGANLDRFVKEQGFQYKNSEPYVHEEQIYICGTEHMTEEKGV